ncbi:MAG TPA: Crp/Fnr family transcriptional regulator [Candidatus Saccharimonadales bacterium]|nr:Crp/Fnr family transcriptional regulator [Candidatus Saccharimonadales bacterium]
MFATRKQTDELVELFRSKGVRQSYKKGNYIIRPGETPPGVFYIQQGLVKAYDITKYGENNLLIVRKDGEIFPLIWALTGEERHIIYEALSTPTITCQVSRNTFTHFLQSNPEAQAPLLDMTIEMYRLHSERILNLEYRSVRERLISFLFTMMHRFGTVTKDGTLISVPLRHQDIASSINATRETTSREIATLQRKGLLENSQQNILIKNPKELQKYLQR